MKGAAGHDRVEGLVSAELLERHILEKVPRRRVRVADRLVGAAERRDRREHRGRAARERLGDRAVGDAVAPLCERDGTALDRVARLFYRSADEKTPKECGDVIFYPEW